VLRTVLSPAHTRWTCAKASLWYSAYRWRHHDVERRDYRPKRQRATSPETFIPTAHAPARRPGFLPWSRHVRGGGGGMLPFLPSPGHPGRRRRASGEEGTSRFDTFRRGKSTGGTVPSRRAAYSPPDILVLAFWVVWMPNCRPATNNNAPARPVI
jgi:hypothetical protein